MQPIKDSPTKDSIASAHNALAELSAREAELTNLLGEAAAKLAHWTTAEAEGKASREVVARVEDELTSLEAEMARLGVRRKTLQARLERARHLETAKGKAETTAARAAARAATITLLDQQAKVASKIDLAAAALAGHLAEYGRLAGEIVRTARAAGVRDWGLRNNFDLDLRLAGGVLAARLIDAKVNERLRPTIAIVDGRGGGLSLADWGARYREKFEPALAAAAAKGE